MRTGEGGSSFTLNGLGRGLMICIELVEDRATREPLKGERLGQLMGQLMGQLKGHLTSRGVLMIPGVRYTHVMRLMPSLTLPRKPMFKALDIFGDGLAALWARVCSRAGGVRSGGGCITRSSPRRRRALRRPLCCHRADAPPSTGITAPVM